MGEAARIMGSVAPARKRKGTLERGVYETWYYWLPLMAPEGYIRCFCSLSLFSQKIQCISFSPSQMRSGRILANVHPAATLVSLIPLRPVYSKLPCITGASEPRKCTP